QAEDGIRYLTVTGVQTCALPICRVGAIRILELLQRYSIRASFFMPAVSALLHPDEARAYVDAGHELGLHGWIHERNMLLDASSRSEERRVGEASGAEGAAGQWRR